MILYPPKRGGGVYMTFVLFTAIINDNRADDDGTQTTIAATTKHD